MWPPAETRTTLKPGLTREPFEPAQVRDPTGNSRSLFEATCCHEFERSLRTFETND